MQAEGKVRRVAVIDCDVHQGNGTAALTAGDASIFTFSIHGEKNFPYRKCAGDLDIGLPDGTTDESYLEALEHSLWRVFTRDDGAGHCICLERMRLPVTGWGGWR